MKIDPAGKPLQITPPNDIQSAGDSNGSPDFSKVLNDTMHRKTSGPVRNAGMVNPVVGPTISVKNDFRPSEWHAAEGLLDSLEDYQSQLQNPEATLKMIEPYVARMSDLSDDARKLLDRLAKDNPLKGVLQETMVHISKEIERFKMGYYVDE